MFCRFGSDDEMRPVAATVWLKEAWMRPGLGVDQLRQRVHVGGLQLLHRAVLEDLARQLVVARPAPRAPPRRWRRRGSWPSSCPRCRPRRVEQDLAELDGRVDVELAAGQRVDLPRQRRRSAAPCRGSSRRRSARSTLTPARSMSASTSTSGQLHASRRRRPGPPLRGARATGSARRSDEVGLLRPRPAAARPAMDARAPPSSSALGGRGRSPRNSRARSSSVVAAAARVEQVGGDQRVEGEARAARCRARPAGCGRACRAR